MNKMTVVYLWDFIYITFNFSLKALDLCNGSM